MNIWLKIGKHSLATGCILILWAFICTLPLRSLSLSEILPSFFQVPFTSDSRWIFIFVGLTPITILSFPLYVLHKKYEKWYDLQTHERILKSIENYKNESSKKK